MGSSTVENFWKFKAPLPKILWSGLRGFKVRALGLSRINLRFWPDVWTSTLLRKGPGLFDFATVFIFRSLHLKMSLAFFRGLNKNSEGSFAMEQNFSMHTPRRRFLRLRSLHERR